MSIWHHTPTLNEPNARIQRGMCGLIAIELVDIGDDFLTARMPVDERTRQPVGLLHGGASVVLAETLASVGSMTVVDAQHHHCVGLEINANHLAAARDGFVLGTARPIHLGRSTHIWDIRITNAAGKLSCVSRCTMAVLQGAYPA